MTIFDNRVFIFRWCNNSDMCPVNHQRHWGEACCSHERPVGGLLGAHVQRERNKLRDNNVPPGRLCIAARLSILHQRRRPFPESVSRGRERRGTEGKISAEDSGAAETTYRY